jgi:alkylation response protein AidB-like acyl-CoA dehydrogenase
MQFEFTPEQIQLRKTVREFAEAEIAPHVLQWDEEQIFPLEAIKHAGRLGFLGAIFPEELGGAGLGYIDYAIIIEELARVDPSVGLIVAAHNSLCTNHIFLAGTDDQRAKYIPKLATGEWIGSWALTEPESGSDAGSCAPKPSNKASVGSSTAPKLSSPTRSMPTWL